MEGAALELGIARTSDSTDRRRAHLRLGVHGPFALRALVTHRGATFSTTVTRRLRKWR
jgi:hypothetical protein